MIWMGLRIAAAASNAPINVKPAGGEAGHRAGI